MKRLLLMTILVFSVISLCNAEIIEKIYAVVNGELITYSELKSTEAEMTRLLSQQFKGDELKKEMEKMKKELMDRLIEQKIILSYAREENIDVQGDIELITKNLKEQNNFKTDEELQQAMASQGIDYHDWLKQVTDSRIQTRYIMREIGSKIKIDNAAIMEYYKKNITEFTNPAVMTLQCIYLDRPNYTDPEALKTRQTEITEALKNGKFDIVAGVYSELPGENKFTLGEFKKGELDKTLEAAAVKLKEGELSEWVETEPGYYILKMAKYVAPKLVEYKDVRQKIEMKIHEDKQSELLKEYLVKLKAESHIKIYEKF